MTCGVRPNLRRSHYLASTVATWSHDPTNVRSLSPVAVKRGLELRRNIRTVEQANGETCQNVADLKRDRGVTDDAAAPLLELMGLVVISPSASILATSCRAAEMSPSMAVAYEERELP